MLAVVLGMGYDHDNWVGRYFAQVWYGGPFLLYEIFRFGAAQKKADSSIRMEW